MKSSKNTLLSDYADNPDLKAALGGLTGGDKFTLTLHLTVIANDDERIESGIDEIEYDIPEAPEGEESGDVIPTADEPVMLVIAKRADKPARVKKPAPAKADVEGDE